MFSFPVKHNFSLAQLTTFKIGGPANYFFVAKSKSDLIQIIKEANDNHIKYFILGNGSDVLVSDQGFNGLVIKIEIDHIEVNDNQITAGAGVKTGTLLSKCKNEGLAGIEFLAGIPATVGGLIWANAGSPEKSICQAIKQITVLDENNQEKILEPKDCIYSYRDSIFKHKNYIILDAIFTLKPGKTKDIEEKIKQYIQQKVRAQPQGQPSIGSIFKNPDGDKKAWQLIDEVDLRGYKIGGAQVSEKHANFIINTGQATASDVIMLTSLIKQKVRDNLGVQLMEEVKYVGF